MLGVIERKHSVPRCPDYKRCPDVRGLIMYCAERKRSVLTIEICMCPDIRGKINIGRKRSVLIIRGVNSDVRSNYILCWEET